MGACSVSSEGFQLVGQFSHLIERKLHNEAFRHERPDLLLFKEILPPLVGYLFTQKTTRPGALWKNPKNNGLLEAHSLIQEILIKPLSCAGSLFLVLGNWHEEAAPNPCLLGAHILAGEADNTREK